MVLQQDKVKLNDALESIIEESGLEAEQLEQLKSKQRAASTDQESAKEELIRLRKHADEADRNMKALTTQLEAAQEERDDFQKKMDELDASAMQVCRTSYSTSFFMAETCKAMPGELMRVESVDGEW